MASEEKLEFLTRATLAYALANDWLGVEQVLENQGASKADLKLLQNLEVVRAVQSIAVNVFDMTVQLVKYQVDYEDLDVEEDDYITQLEIAANRRERERDEAEYRQGVAEGHRYSQEKKIYGAELAETMTMQDELNRYNAGDDD